MSEVSGLVFFVKLAGIGWKVRLKKIVAVEFGTGTTLVYEFRHGLPMKVCILNQKNPKCLDRIWQTNVLQPKLKIWVWGIIYPYHAFFLPGIGPKARPRSPENGHFREKVYFGQRRVDTTVLAVVTIVVSIRSFCCRSGREQLL